MEEAAGANSFYIYVYNALRRPLCCFGVLVVMCHEQTTGESRHVGTTT